MANGFYQEGAKHWARGNINWLASGGSAIRCALVDTADYTVDLATHEFRNATGLDGSGQEETSGNMTLIDAATDGIIDANDVVFTGTSGDQCEGIVLYENVGSAATDRLLIWWDSVTGMPVTLGGDVTVAWDNGANKIAKV